MAEIILAKTAGFCFGVSRAVDKVYELLSTGEKIYTYGPIIHNKEVVKDLEDKGVVTLETEDELKKVSEGVVVIRSHGIPKYINDYLDEKGVKYVDMTCPFVKRIHKVVSSLDEDDTVLIAGNPDHPEVIGIRGWCRCENMVIETSQQAEDFMPREGAKITLVSQTTFSYNKFQEFVEIFTKKGYHITVVNTVCDATRGRQKEAFDIAQKVDVMIVIGDKHSSNSRKLYEICSRECENTCFIQTLAELMGPDMVGIRDKISVADSVGITAGASTPKNIIEEVQKHVRHE